MTDLCFALQIFHAINYVLDLDNFSVPRYVRRVSSLGTNIDFVLRRYLMRVFYTSTIHACTSATGSWGLLVANLHNCGVFHEFSLFVSVLSAENDTNPTLNPRTDTS